MSHPRARVVLAVALSVIAVIPAGSASGQPGPDPSPEGPPGIEGVWWRLEAVGIEGPIVGPPGEVVATFHLADSVATGADGCGPFLGSYELADGALTLAGLTRIDGTCPEGLPERPADLLPVLAAVRGYVAGDGTLTLTDEDGTSLLTFTAESPLRPEGSFVVTGYYDAASDDGLVPPLDPGSLSVSFEPDGRLAGTSGCGLLTGGYTVDGEAIGIGVQATGTADCPMRKRDEEVAFTTALGTAASWAVTHPSIGLVLLDEEGLARVTLRPQAPTSVLGDWIVKVFAGGGDGALLGALDGTKLTIAFGPDEDVEGSTGCRPFEGGYFVDGDHIAIGPVSPIGERCQGDLRRQERRFLAVLDAATTWSRDDESLRMFDPGGELVLDLVPA